MDQISLVIPIRPGRTTDARDFARELETGRNADCRRAVFVSAARQRPLPVYSSALGLSLSDSRGEVLCPALNHRCSGQALAQEQAGRAGARLAGR